MHEANETKVREFLSEIKNSTEFRAVVLEAGQSIDLCDDTLTEEINSQITLLVGQIYFELTDERFGNKKHHRLKLYNNGCRGPLCRKAERDRSRARYQKGNTLLRTNRRGSIILDAAIDYIKHKYEQNRLAEISESGGIAL